MTNVHICIICRYNNNIIYFRHIQQYLSALLQTMANKKNVKNVSYLTKYVHVWPDFHGNRSPLADPTLKGMVDNLRIIYIFTII